MRLISRRDTSLAVALIAGALIAFERPFRWILDIIQDVEQRHHIDLLPALTLLSVVFVFHQYKKRLQARAEVTALGREVEQTRARTEELERLVSLGRALANALDRATLEQELWRTLPSFVGYRECTILTRHSAGWECLVRDPQMLSRRSLESLEEMIAQLPSAGMASAAREGEIIGEDVCFPMIAGELVVGGIIVRNDPLLTREDKLTIGAAGALVAIATRNAHLLHDAKQSGARDALTGCFTRGHALEILQNELRRARRTERPVSLIMFDVDEFKQVNDRHGHLQGDAVLASVGSQLSQVLRSTDVRCRYGGDEFMVILPDTPILGAQQVADCLRREIAETARGDGARRLFVTASLGVACAMPGELNAMAVIGRADEALYRAKRAGRDRYCVTASPTLASAAAAPLPRANAS